MKTRPLPEPPTPPKALSVGLRCAGILLATFLVPACGIGSAGTLTPTVAPQIPSNVTAKAGNGSATVSWTISPAATSYAVLRSSIRGGPYSQVLGGGSVNGTTFKDMPLTNGKAYFYVVSASNTFGQSLRSEEVQVTPGIFATRVAAGSEHSIALLTDGSLWTWGDNTEGQLGPSSAQSLSSLAVPIPLTGVVDFACSGKSSMAILADGSLWTWGGNFTGQLGIGSASPVSSSTPLSVPLPAGIVPVAVSSGIYSELMLASDGTVWGWGSNGSGQLGFSTSTGQILQPTQVPGISGVTQVSSGGYHSLALKSDGTVWAWGQNTDGQLGDGTTTPTYVPQQVPELTGVIEVRAGVFHSLALGADGTVWAWGSMASGTNGWGTATPKGVSRPTLVPGLNAIREIGAGSLYSVALRSDGTVWTWGANPVGQLGTLAGSSVLPVQIPSLLGVQSISGGQNSVLAIQTGGLLWGWGDNTTGNLGNGTSGIVPSPVQAADLTNLQAAGGGTYFGAALTKSQVLWSWGYGPNGQLGDGEAGADTSFRVHVAMPPALNAPTALAVAQGSVLVLNSDGTVWNWGYNLNGALGNGSAVSSPGTSFDVPSKISGLTGITKIAAGGQNGFAIGSGGTVWGWGSNTQGNVGCGSSSGAILSPTALPVLTGITAIGAGYSGGLAANAGGAVWTWGWNLQGQLGIGTTGGQSNSPVSIPGFSGVVAVAQGYLHDLALKSDGTVWAWGDNSFGQMGGATSASNQPSPVQIPGLTSIVAISAGIYHGLALRSDGTVWAWGDNSQGEIGDGTYTGTSASAVTQVSNLSGVVSISGGYFNSMAVCSDGTLWAWGTNNSGELGIGSSGMLSVPTLIIR